MENGVSAGEAGGIFAGAIAVLATLGGGVRWLLNWNDSRALTRRAKLAGWHDELAAREDKLERHQADHERRQAEYQHRIETRLGLLEHENRALRRAFELVTGVLRAADPGNPALEHADQIIAQAAT